MKRFFATALPLLALGIGYQALAQDGSVTPGRVGGKVTLAPLRIELDGEQQYDTMRVANPSQRPVGIQVRAFGWSQDNGEDVYQPTNEVMVSPAIVMIEPGETQVFRVMRRPLPQQGERRYRIAIDQLPDPALEKNGQAMTRIRFTIPLFVDRATSAPAQLDWAIEGNSLRLANTGQQTARMVNLTLKSASGAEIPVDGASMQYVQGGAWLRWTLPDGCPSGPVAVSAQADEEPVNAQVVPNCS